MNNLRGKYMVDREVSNKARKLGKVAHALFIWLLENAVWRDTTITVYHGREVRLNRGQVTISSRALAKEIDLTHQEVRTAAKRLVTEGLITCAATEVTQSATVWTVRNYEEIQAFPRSGVHTEKVKQHSLTQSPPPNQHSHVDHGKVGKTQSPINKSGNETDSANPALTQSPPLNQHLSKKEVKIKEQIKPSMGQKPPQSRDTPVAEGKPQLRAVTVGVDKFCAGDKIDNDDVVIDGVIYDYAVAGPEKVFKELTPEEKRIAGWMGSTDNLDVS